MKFAVSLFAALLLSASASAELVIAASATGHRDFPRAKRAMARIYGSSGTTFYCGCPYTGKVIDLRTCGYRIRKDAGRAKRIEWEHIVPAWAIGHQRQCWQPEIGRTHVYTPVTHPLLV